jgi:hypothetical protein
MSHVDKGRAEKREKEVCAAAGRQTEIGTTRIDIVDPGTLLPYHQAALIRALVDVS